MRQTFSVFLLIIPLFIGCSTKREESSNEQLTAKKAVKIEKITNAHDAAKPPVIETSLTRETARQLIQTTAPSKFSEMNHHTKVRTNLERNDCTTQYLENLKKEGIVIDVKFGKNDAGYTVINHVEFAPQWQSFFDVTATYFSSYTSVTGWSYVYLNPTLARVVGIKQKGEKEAIAEVMFAPNKLFEVGQKYECTRLSESWFNFKFRVKFELWDDGWRIISLGNSVE